MNNTVNGKRFRMMSNEKLNFLQEFLRRPYQVGSFIPSSRFLERRIVEIAAIPSAQMVVELGPGTGGTTRAILQALPEESKLLAIEINKHFVDLLRNENLPRLTVHLGNAEEIKETLSFYGFRSPDVILSGIPFSTLPPSTGSLILRAVWDSLAPGGCFIAYQFMGRVASLGREILGEPQVDIELLNVPPLRIYRWQKPVDLA